MNNKRKTTILNILFMLCVMSMILVLGGIIIPVHAATSGDLLLTINNLTPEYNYNFGGEITSTLDDNLVIGMPNYNTGDINQGSVAGIVIIVNGITGELLLTIENPSDIDYFGSDVEIMPNGNLLVSASGYNEPGAVYLYDVTTGELLLTINDHVRIANNGDFIAGTSDDNIVVGSVYETSNMGTVFLFNGTSGEVLLEIDNPSGDFNGMFGASVASTSNGDLLISTSSNDDVNAVYLYDGNTGEQLLMIPPPNGSWRPSIAVTSDDNLVIGDRYDEFIYIFDGTTGQQLVKITSPDSGLVHMGWDIEITPDGNILASNEIWEIGQSLAFLFDGATGQLLLTIENPNSDLDESESILTQSATTPDGKLIVSIPYAYYNNGDSFLGAVYVFEGLTSNSNDAPIITSLIADDPDDLDNVYSDGDTITILFDSDTNTPGGIEVLQTKVAVDDMYNFTESLGETYTGQWITADTFTITISNTTGAAPPIINYTTVTPAGITPILSSNDTSDPSSAISPVLSGDFGMYEELFCGEPKSYYASIIYGTNGSDYLRGTNNADLIFGYAGNDFIRGVGGDDCIYAGDGNDFVQGNGGNDIIYAGDGDRVWIVNIHFC